MNYRERMAAQNRKALAEQRIELEPWIISVALNVADGLYDDENEWDDDLTLKENLFEWIPFNEEDFREYVYAILEEDYDERTIRRWSSLPLGVYLEMIAVGLPDDAMTPYPNTPPRRPVRWTGG